MTPKVIHFDSDFDPVKGHLVQEINHLLRWTAELGQLKLSTNSGAVDHLRDALQEKLLVMVKKTLESLENPPFENLVAAAEAGPAQAEAKK